MKHIETPHAPRPIGPYSQAVIHNNVVSCSGQIGMTIQGVMASSLKEQTLQIFKNIEAVLAAAESNVESILRCNIFLIDMADFAEVNALYQDFVKAPYPARSTIEVQGLPKGARIEIEVTAAQKNRT